MEIPLAFSGSHSDWDGGGGSYCCFPFFVLLFLIWFLFKLRSVKLVRPAKGLMSIIWLEPRSRPIKLVRLANGSMLLILLSPRRRTFKPVRPAKGLMSII